MATTYTRTNILTIGETLAEERNLQDLSKKMKEIEKRNESHFLQAGIELEETNVFNDIDLIKYQWEKFILNIVEQADREEVRQIISQLDELKENEEPSSEKNSGFKIR